MKFYFDQQRLNLDHIPEIKEIRPFDQFCQYYNIRPAEFVYSTDFQEQGVYLIEVSKLTHQWTGKNQFSHSFDLFEGISKNVVESVKLGKLRIVIISIVEGDSFVNPTWDAFRAITESMRSLQLPAKSVLIVSANVRATVEYRQWLDNTHEDDLIDIIPGTEGPSSICFCEEISAKKVKDCYDVAAFSSLNRAHRPIRTEHLFWLAEKNLLDQGLVSGGIYFKEQGIHNPLYTDVSNEEWVGTLISNFPRSVDFSVEDLKVKNPANEINNTVYQSSMLSVVTETYFQEPGLYLSEKTFKPICAGSLQLVLGQPYVIDYLKDKFDIDIRWQGIDCNFDSIEDNKSRFLAFHKSLLEWTSISGQSRAKILKDNIKKIEDNFNKIRNTNFKKIIVEDIVSSTKKYFHIR